MNHRLFAPRSQSEQYARTTGAHLVRCPRVVGAPCRPSGPSKGCTWDKFANAPRNNVHRATLGLLRCAWCMPVSRYVSILMRHHRQTPVFAWLFAAAGGHPGASCDAAYAHPAGVAVTLPRTRDLLHAPGRVDDLAPHPADEHGRHQARSKSISIDTLWQYFEDDVSEVSPSLKSTASAQTAVCHQPTPAATTMHDDDWLLPLCMTPPPCHQ